MRHIIFLAGIWPYYGKNIALNTTRPIACYQLKHWLKQFGISSQVIDFCQLMTSEDIISLLSQFVSDETFAIAISATYWHGSGELPISIRDTIAFVRSKWPNLKIISGGARKVKSPELFDVNFVGESEDKLTVWCQQQLKRHSLLNKKFNITQLNHRFDDSDAIMHGEALPIELGRGCVFKCKFCSHQNLGKPKFTYQRYFDYVTDEMSYNYEKFGTTKYMFLDDTVNEDMDKIHKLAVIKDTLGFQIEWTGYLRADLVWSKKDSADLLLNSGLKSCFFGVETFNHLAGKSIDKSWAAKHGKEYLPHLYTDIWKNKINIHLNFIAGLPNETIESMSDTLAWCKANQLGSARFAPLTLYTEKDDDSAVSEFTKNYTANGYKNVVESTGYWETDTLTRNSATQFSHNANKELHAINRVSSWDVFNATNVGYTTNEVMSWDYKNYVKLMMSARHNFISTYINKLKNLKE